MDISYTLARGETHDDSSTVWTVQVHNEQALIEGPSGASIELPAAGTLIEIAQSLATAAPGAFLIQGPQAYVISCSLEFEQVLPLILRADDHEYLGYEDYEADSDFVLVNSAKWATLANNCILPWAEDFLEEFQLAQTWACISFGEPLSAMYGLDSCEIGLLNQFLGIEIFKRDDDGSEYRIFPLRSRMEHVLEFAHRSLMHSQYDGWVPDHPRGWERAVESAVIDVLEHPEWVAPTWGYAFLVPPDWLDEVEHEICSEWNIDISLEPEELQLLLERLHANNPDYSTQLSDYSGISPHV